MRSAPLRICVLLGMTLSPMAFAAVDCSKPVGDLDITPLHFEPAIVGGALYWHGLAGDRGSYSLEFGGFPSFGRTETYWAIWVRYPDGKFLVAEEFGTEEWFHALEAVCGEAWAKQYGRGASIHRASGRAVQSFDAADLNNDGYLDYIDFAPAGVRVHLRDVTGVVTSTVAFSAGIVPELGFSKIVAADFNGDAKLDVAVTRYGDGPSNPGRVAILLGNSDGTFGAPRVTTLTTYVRTMAAADFNGDGKTDLAVGTGPSSTVVFLAGQGDGSFAAPVSYASERVTSLVAVDLSGDGLLDLAATGSTAVSTYLNLGGGRFGTAITTAIPIRADFLAFTDLNIDGKSDLVAACKNSNAVLVLMGNGNGGFQAPVAYVAGNYPASLALLPLRDSTTLVFSPDSLSGQGVGMHLNSRGVAAAPRYRFIGGSPSAVTTATLNADSQPDVLVANGNLVAIVSQSDGGFAAPVRYAIGSGAVAVAAGDFNGDGKQDAVTAGGSAVNVLLGAGDGTLRAPTSVTVSQNARSLAVADFNGDGKLDAAVGAYGVENTGDAGGISILIGRGDGTFLPPATIAVSGLRPTGVHSADFDGDGKLDLVAIMANPNGTPLTLAFFAGNGAGTFMAARTLLLSRQHSDFAKLAVGDVDGDGKLDLAYATNYQLGLLRGDGTGRFSEVTPRPATDGGSTGVALTDLNGDGKLDLVVTHCCGELDGTYLLGNGDGSFQIQQHFPSGSSPSAVTTIKANSDRLPGLVVVAKGEPGAYNSADPAASGTAILLGPLFPDAPTGPVITDPASGSTLAGASVTITWGAVIGATKYKLEIGNMAGEADLFSEETTGTSLTVSDLPTDGRDLYVKLTAFVEGGDGTPSTYKYKAFMQTEATP